MKMYHRCFSAFAETGYYHGAEINYTRVRAIPWFDGKPPAPGPFCGLRKELCPSEKASEELSREYFKYTFICELANATPIIIHLGTHTIHHSPLDVLLLSTNIRVHLRGCAY